MADLANNEQRDERLAQCKIWLADQIGPERRAQLLARFGSARAVFAAGQANVADTPGLPAKATEGLFDPDLERRACEELRRISDLGYRWLLDSDPEFPIGLRQIPQPPLALTVRGSLLATDVHAVAIVGSRKCSDYGIRIAERFARDLAAKGITIISGLARGIDAASHRGALAVGGRTIAVLASGLAKPAYPG